MPEELLLFKIDKDELKTIPQYHTPPIDRFTLEEAEQVLESYSIYYQLTKTQTIHSITFWVQNGGCLKLVPNKMFDINNTGQQEELNVLRKEIKNIRKKGTVRQLARTLLPLIIETLKIRPYPGPLAKKFKQLDPEINVVFCNDIFIDSPDCPSNIKHLLIRRKDLIDLDHISTKNARNQTRR